MSCFSKVTMGVNVSKSSDEVLKRHRIIEKEIKEDRQKNESVFKLLLLGAGESGKSTIVKQMRILHTSGFTDDEVQQQKKFIAHNVLSNIAAIVRAMETLSISYENPDRQTAAAIILKAEENWFRQQNVSTDEWMYLKLIWMDGGVQQCFQRANEYQLGDSTKYFCDDMDRIASPNYRPSYDDILHARVSTTGIVEISFPFRGLILTVIDVGGQRSQRKKWIHCFEGVNSLIFIAALSEYNQMLYEDANMNRMQEALKLFETVCNCQWFRNTPTILFLNKKDLFAQKLKQFSLTLAFPEYQGSQTYEETADYIEKQFQRRKASEMNQIYTHKTCATDTRNIEFVMAASFDIILARNMKEAGFT